MQLVLQRRQKQNVEGAQRREPLTLPATGEVINELDLGGRMGIFQVDGMMKEGRSEEKHSGQSKPMGKGKGWSRNMESLE